MAVLFPTVVALVFVWTNGLAWMYGSNPTVGSEAMLALIALYVGVSLLPLTFLGGYLAKDVAGERRCPVQSTRDMNDATNEGASPRPLQLFISGLAPYVGIHGELSVILNSLRGHHSYPFAGTSLVMVVLTIMVSSLACVIVLHPQLRRNEYPSWWDTFVNGGMTAVFCFGHACYFYYANSAMSGLLQGSYFFGYTAVLVLGIFLAFGSAGFQCSYAFVRHLVARGHTN